MTGTVDDATPSPGGSTRTRSDQELDEITEAAALLEQAKGVLIFRYAIDACTAFGLIERWAVESGTGIETVAHALVHDICQGDRTELRDPSFVRWLEERLRHQFPAEPDSPAGSPSGS